MSTTRSSRQSPRQYRPRRAFVLTPQLDKLYGVSRSPASEQTPYALLRDIARGTLTSAGYSAEETRLLDTALWRYAKADPDRYYVAVHEAAVLREREQGEAQ